MSARVLSELTRQVGDIGILWITDSETPGGTQDLFPRTTGSSTTNYKHTINPEEAF